MNAVAVGADPIDLFDQTCTVKASVDFPFSGLALPSDDPALDDPRTICPIHEEDCETQLNWR
jgi:hypothetical protein